MPRHRKCRFVRGNPDWDYFKPRGVPFTELEEIEIPLEEFESIKLSDLKGMEQEQAAAQMKVSRQTYGRILISARKKIADAIINGKAIKIKGGENNMTGRKFTCYACDHAWEEPYGAGSPTECPKCKSENIHRAPEDRGRARCGVGRGFGRRQGICRRQTA